MNIFAYCLELTQESSMEVSRIFLPAPHHALSKMAANKTSRKHDITAPSPLILPPKVVNPSASAKVHPSES